jgi:hypothetical protein
MTNIEQPKIIYATQSEPEVSTPVVYKITGGNDWSIVAKKFLYGLLATFIGFALTYTITFLQTEDFSTLPSWMIAIIPIITGLLLAVQNAWSHRMKIEEA